MIAQWQKATVNTFKLAYFPLSIRKKVGLFPGWWIQLQRINKALLKSPSRKHVIEDSTSLRESVGNYGMYLKENQRQPKKTNTGGTWCKERCSLCGICDWVSILMSLYYCEQNYQIMQFSLLKNLLERGFEHNKFLHIILWCNQFHFE